jgi:hypothetical protein
MCEMLDGRVKLIIAIDLDKAQPKVVNAHTKWKEIAKQEIAEADLPQEERAKRLEERIFRGAE